MIISKFLNSLRWVDALDKASAGDFAKARTKLNAIDPSNTGIPNREYYLLKSFVLMKLNDKSAKGTLAEAMNAIDASHKINQDEREYLKKYAEYVLVSLYDRSNKRTVNCGGIDFSNVPQRTRDMFPLV